MAVITFGPVVVLSEAKLTTSLGKHVKDVDNLHIVRIMQKRLTSHQQTSELMSGFEESVAI